ncbi:MAG: ABC-type transport auxiliary lipoprotein family protein [Pseudomonadota bacterium]
MIRSCLIAAAAVALTACSVLPKPAPANVVYRLSVGGETVQPRTDATVIRVDRPSTIDVFNTRSIVVSPDGRRLSTAAQAEWPELTPNMLQQLMVDAFAQTPSLIGVLPQSGTRTDIRLHLTIKNFEAQFDQGEGLAPLAVVSYTATLANAADRNLIATFTVEHTSRARAARISSIVAAIETANAEAMRDIVDWVESVNEAGMMDG